MTDVLLTEWFRFSDETLDELLVHMLILFDVIISLRVRGREICLVCLSHHIYN